MAVRKKHVQRRIVEQVLGTPWQVLPEKMDEIVNLLQLRQDGYELDDEEIEMRIGSVRSGDDDGITMVGNSAVIQVYGTLFQRANLITRYSGGTSTEQLKTLITQAGNDTKVAQIILDIDSPGGSALGNEEIVQLIEGIRKTKPVIASVNGLAASAAYYIASPATTIYASPSSLIGSIGTILVHRETSAADEKAGVKFTIIRSGRFKADGNDREPLDEQARDTLNERVVVYHDQFVEAVSRGRKISEGTVRDEFGDGKMFIAQDALKRGMIDKIGTLQDILERFSSAAPSTTVTAVFQKETQMDKRLKAALFARGLVQSADAADDVCEAALNGWYAATNKTKPESAEDCLKDLNGPSSQVLVSSSLRPDDAPAATEPKKGTLLPASDVDLDKIRKDERYRCEEIRAIASQLGGVPEDSVNEAIENGLEPEEFARKAITLRSDSVTPVKPRIQGLESEVDKFNESAADAMMMRAGHQVEGATSNDLQGRSLVDLAHIALQTLAPDVRLGQYPRPDEVARHFLAMGGEDLQIGAAASNDPAYHGSGSFPNLLSVLANKMLDRAMEYAPATYSTWTNRLPDVPDFKPATVASAGEFNHLPQHALGRPFDHSDFKEGVSWIQINSYGNEFVLTPDMIVNDDLDAFAQAMRTRGIAHELTLNKLVIDHLISNPRVSNGNNLFDPSHNNDITTGGGAPDSAQLSENRKRHRRQKGISGINKLRYEPRYVLVSPEWETQTEQTLMAVIYPQSDITSNNSPPNTFRGRYTAVVEPMLDDVADNKVWYTIVDPGLLRGIVHAFQTGYGQGGRRRSYFRNETQCRHFQLEGRFATTAVNHQAIVRNKGS